MNLEKAMNIFERIKITGPLSTDNRPVNSLFVKIV